MKDEVKMLCFAILDFGGRGGTNFPFILSKIVASTLLNIVCYLILARNITDSFRLFLQYLQSRGAQYSNTSGQFVLNVAVWFTFFAWFLIKANNWQSTISYNNFQLNKMMQNRNIAECQKPFIGYIPPSVKNFRENCCYNVPPNPSSKWNQFAWSTYREPTHKCT